MKKDDCPVVVICGASAGVGRATAHAFAAAGYAVGLLARSDEGLAAATAELQDYDMPTLAISADVADANAVALAAQRFEAALGPEVTYLGAVHGTLAALPLMRARNRGVIIQVGSALAYRAIPLQSAYCAAKFALRGFTDSLRCELIHQRSEVKVCMVQLPAINTPQFDWARNKLGQRVQPVPPIHDPGVAARAILSVASAPPRELWVGLPTLKAIIGNQFFPGLLDRLLARRAWQGQLSEGEPEPAGDNLFHSVDGLHEVQGRFTRRSRGHALALSSARVTALLGTCAVLLLLLLI